MIQYIDVIPPIINFLSNRMDTNVYGNRFPADVQIPALLVRSVGGKGFTRLQLIYRAEKDFEALEGCIQAANILEAQAGQIDGIRVLWCEKDTAPISDMDNDGKQEAWCYMRLEHLEA